MKRFAHFNTLIVAVFSLAFGIMLAGRLDLMPKPLALRQGQSVAMATAQPVALTSKEALRAAEGLSQAFVEVSEHVKPAVVNITTSARQRMARGGDQFFRFGPNDRSDEFFKWFFGDEDGPFRFRGPQQEDPQSQPQQPQGEGRLVPRGQGSGFIVEPSGYILTNAHVVDGADAIEVRVGEGRDEEVYEATLVGKDEKTDLAVLKIEAKNPLPYISFGNSNDLRIGEWVVAIGNPFGVGKTVTSGILSAKERSIGYGPYDEYLQTDASINPGNSGGPLVNLQGQVIGVNAAIYTPSGGFVGIGFAIPSEMARNIYEQLKNEGKVTRGWLGVYIGPVSREVAEAMDLPGGSGVLVRKVMEGSPAGKAGVQDGDILLNFDGKALEDEHQLLKLVANTPVGKSVDTVVWRDGKKHTLAIKVARRDDEAIAKGEASGGKTEETVSTDRLGLTVEDLTPDIAKRLKAEGQEGVVVTNLRGGGPADKAGLQKGDIIKRLNKRHVVNTQAFSKVLENSKKDSSFLVEFARQGHTDFTVVKVE